MIEVIKLEVTYYQRTKARDDCRPFAERLRKQLSRKRLWLTRDIGHGIVGS